MNLGSFLMRAAKAHPGRAALRLDDLTVTYRVLDDMTAQIAGLLRERGLEPGDRVGVMLPNTVEFAAIYYGVLRAGGVVVPLNPLLKAREVAYYLGDSEARLIFGWHAVADQARKGAAQAVAEVIVVDPATFPGLVWAVRPLRSAGEQYGEDTAVILYTSGTTGRPKGAELTHANLGRNAQIVAGDLLRLTDHDVIFGGLPLFHSFGQTCTLNAAVAAGACLTLLPRFTPGAALELLAQHRATVLAAVPTMYIALLNHPGRTAYDTSALRLGVSGGSAMPVEVLRRFESEFGCVVLEGYGLSETSPVASFNHPDRERVPGSIGTPIRGVQMRVIDDRGDDVPQGGVGEIVIRGHNVMKGYWRRPEETAMAIPDGWFRSGDLGTVDKDGYFSIVDRKKDMIIRGGYNVYPREIEEVLHELPSVAQAAVIGVPHPELGEEVAAAVVLKPGHEVTAEELRALVKTRVAAYKYPRKVWITDALPTGPTGKVLKREIVPPPEPGER